MTTVIIYDVEVLPDSSDIQSFSGYLELIDGISTRRFQDRPVVVQHKKKHFRQFSDA